MAKVKDSQKILVDIYKNDTIDAKGKTALEINVGLGSNAYKINTEDNGKTLIIKQGETYTTTINNASGIKHIKYIGDDDYTDILSANLINYTGAYTPKKGSYTGTKYNDTFTNDVIAENNKFKGGLGTNKVNIYTTQKFGDDEIILTKGENLKIVLADVTGSPYKYCELKQAGSDLKINVYSEQKTNDDYQGNVQGTITIKNYFKKDVLTNTGSFYFTDKNGNNTWNIRVNAISNKLNPDNITDSSFKGSWVDDSISAKLFVAKDKSGNEITTETSGYEKVKGVTIDFGDALNKNTGRGSRYADTIKGGAKKDEVWASSGNDTYTLGKGENWIGYEEDLKFDTDTVNLTKGEIMKLDIKEYGYNKAEEFFSDPKNKIKVSGKDLVVETKNGNIILKNFGNKDVVGADGKVILNLKGSALYDGSVNIDLKTALVESGSGTWHNDLINKEDYEIKKKGTLVTDTLTKGLKINGKAGNDTITGSRYSDTIKGGDGNDTITGGTGNDKLYGEGGENTFVFNAGDGQDTVFSGKGEDTLDFKYRSIADLSFERAKNKGKDTNDLIIKYTDKDSVTIKDFYKLNKKKQQTTSIKHITTKEGTLDVSGLVFNDTDFIKSDNFLIGTQNDDVVENMSGYVFTREGNDTITAGTEDTLINGGVGDDILKRAENSSNNITYQFSAYGDGHDTIVDDFQGYSYVDFTNITQDSVVGFSNSLYYEEKGNDLIIHYGDNNTITVKDYIYSLSGQKAKFFYTSDNEHPIASDIDDKGIIVNASTDNGEILNGSLLYDTTINGGAGNDTITGGAKPTTIFGGNGDDVLKRKDDSTSSIIYSFNIEGDGNDVIYDTLTNDTFDRILWFYGEGKTTLSENYLRDAISYKMSGNDLIMTYGTVTNSSVTIKDFAHSFVGTAENRQWRLKLGGGYLALKEAQNTIYTNVTHQTTLNNLNWKYVLAGSGDNTVTTKTDFATTVYGGSGTNTINSYGNDTIVVDREGNDTINLFGANTEKSVWVEKGSKATINNVMDLTSSSSSVPLTINFTDQDFTKNDIMLYHNYYTNELHFVTRNYGLDIALTGIYDGTFNEYNGDGSNYIYEEDNNAFAKFNIIDKNGNLANIRNLTNYYDMSKHSKEFYNEYEAINDLQNGSTDWLIDGTTEDDSYTTYIPISNAKIDIYDKGGDDELIFESNAFVNENGNSTFFDVIITRNIDNSLASSSFGDDLYFSGNMSTLFNNNASDDTYLCIHNYFDGNNQGAGYIESITDEDDNEIDFDKLTELKNDVANWIATNTDYSSLSEVINNSNIDKSEIMAYFTVAQPY